MKKKIAIPSNKGINPFTKDFCVFKAKPALKTVSAFAMKRLKVALKVPLTAMITATGSCKVEAMEEVVLANRMPAMGVTAALLVDVMGSTQPCWASVGSIVKGRVSECVMIWHAFGLDEKELT